MNFYNFYISLCAAKKVTPSKVAVDVGLSKTAVNGWKTGRSLPTDVSLQLLADYFDQPIEAFQACDDIKEKRTKKITVTESDGSESVYEIQKPLTEREELSRLIDRLTDEEVSAILDRVKNLIFGI